MKPMPGRAYAVGELFQPGCRSYPPGTAKFGMGQLVFFLSAPTSEETVAVRRGAMRLGVAEAGGCLFVLCAVGTMTADAPYAWHLTPKDERLDTETLTPRSQLLIHVLLVDADTGIICAMRHTTMSVRVTRAFANAIRRQSHTAFHPADHDAKVAQASARWDHKALVQIGTMDLAGGDASVEVALGHWSAVDGH